MKLRELAAAALLAASCGVASADDLHATIVPIADGVGGWSTPIEAVHLQAGLFTDTFAFGSFALPVTADGNLSTISFSAQTNIDFVSATLSNGTQTVGYTFEPEVGGFELGSMGPAVFAAGLPLTLTVQGLAGNGLGSPAANGLLAAANLATSYSGNVNFSVSAVPEPGSGALLLSGLSVLGWLVRRRA
jgi:hypothetical protein